jgi:hypothetical protein
MAKPYLRSVKSAVSKRIPKCKMQNFKFLEKDAEYLFSALE